MSTIFPLTNFKSNYEPINILSSAPEAYNPEIMVMIKNILSPHSN